MVKEYRHLFFLKQELVTNGACEEINQMEQRMNELIEALKMLDYPVGLLIEDLKEEARKRTTYEHIVIFTDGGVRNHHDSNQESKAASAFILYGNGEIIKQQGKFIGQTYTLPTGFETEVNSTIAEYAGLFQAADYLLSNQLTAKKYTFVTDCSVMVEQIKNKRRPTNHIFLDCARYAQTKLRELKNAEVKHVPRAHNKWADALVNEVLDMHEREGALC